MKELIGSIVVVIGLLGTGTYGLRKLSEAVKKAALTKVHQGLKPLPRFKKDW